MGDKLRKLKDEGARLLQKGKLEKALKIYQTILERHPHDLTSHLKCGDIYRKLERGAEAIDSYTRVAHSYAQDGLLLKAIAACKLVLEIDVSHTATQAMLAELYAKKSSRTAATLPHALSAATLRRPPGRAAASLAARAARASEAHPSGSASTQQPAEPFRLQPVEIAEGVSRLLPQEPAGVPAGEAPYVEVVQGEVQTDASAEAPETTDPLPAQDEIQAAQEKIQVELELPSIPLFSDLPKNAFIQLMEQMSMRAVAPGDVIIREGDVDDTMYIISSGRVKVTKSAGNSASGEMVLAHLTDGAFFGEMALLSEAPRTASVIAEEETWLFGVSRQVIDEVTHNFPSVKHVLMRFYRQRLLANLVATSPVFRSLDAAQRRSLLEKFKSREVSAGDVLLREGQKGDGLYLVLMGRAEVSTVKGGTRMVLGQLKEGDVFGEMSLLNNAAVGADVRAVTKAIILKLPRQTFAEVISTHPQLLAHISELCAERQATNEELLDDVVEAQKLASEDQDLLLV